MQVKKYAYFLAFFVMACHISAQVSDAYQITNVIYEIEGLTREYPLSQAVEIDFDKVFFGKDKLETYIQDLKVRFENQRVLESADITHEYGDPGENGIIPVSLRVATVDTWNIIALPYPKFDSNSGFELKLKIKDYNFFGSMQSLNGDLNYQINNEQKSTVSANLDFSIPFQLFGYSSNWKTDFSVQMPQDEQVKYNLSTGMNVSFPVWKTSIQLGFVHALIINDRNDSGLYENDRYYFKDTVSLGLPFTLHTFDYLGALTWTPKSSVAANWAIDGIQENRLQGAFWDWGHSLEIGRTDWKGNFREGFTVSTGNQYSYSVRTNGEIDTSIDASIKGYTILMNRIALTGRIEAFYNFHSSRSNRAGNELRGILNERIDSDTAIYLNLDIPVRIATINFEEITGVSWTRYIGFELQASSFFDMALVHDKKSNQFYSFDEGWYSSGFELLVYPAKMRSIYGRISVGFDILEMSQNGWNDSARAVRDKGALRELFFGIGLHY